MARLLVVEDYPSLQLLYRMALEKAGHEVDMVSDGKEALALAKTKHYDLIMLDLILNRTSGLDFLRNLKRAGIDKHTKIVVLSNLKNPVIFEAVARIGVDAYLLKSTYTPKDIMKAIAPYLPGQKGGNRRG